MRKPRVLLVGVGLWAIVHVAGAAVSTQEAARLKSELTPLGAERAGNKGGTIPAWDGGYTTVWPGYRSGQPRPDPFAGEKPILRITPQDLQAHEARLSEGVKALLRRFPSFRIDVYPTHRTAAAPRWIYENTLKNATRARAVENGQVVQSAYGGVPFPIPKSGAEVMWNHNLAWRGASTRYEYSTYVVASRKPVLSTAGTVDNQYPYYYQGGSPENFKGTTTMIKIITTAPPFRVGENLLIQEPLDQLHEGRRSWQYLVGQRRVRRAPNIAYDNPSSVTSGFTFFDESFLFNGALDRYDWKLVGKQEMYVPYNTQQFHTKKTSEILGPDHLNPDHLRWELHRVWVVEATLAAGKRHVMPRRRFYVDEDTWLVVLYEGWDARGALWHVGHALPLLVPELPAVLVLPYAIYDLVKGGYAVSSLFNEGHLHLQVTERRPDAEFTPAALAAGGVR
jgi:hypothetical protein